MNQLTVCLLVTFVACIFANKEDDLVVNLPGLTFVPTFKTYSGYLNANANGTWRMHYMLTESKSKPDTDPLLIWFNGGPGCSSYAGLFEELGPFQVNYDGQTLYENVYSWNAKANVLYLESPIGVGFSYSKDVDSFSYAHDTQTMEQNFNAITDFFTNVQPKYKNRQYFLSGESYAGIYIPMLSQRLIQAINGPTPYVNPNFQGAAIGNGFMNVKLLLNSLVMWSAYHARVNPQKWQKIKLVCGGGQAVDPETIDYSQFLVTQNGIDFRGDNNTACGKLIDPLITVPLNMYPYNFYQDCYDYANIEAPAPNPPHLRRAKRDTQQPQFKGSQTINRDTTSMINKISTDFQWGYPCWNEDALATYSNRKDVQDALHIEDGWRKQQGGKYQWSDCNMDIYNQYHITFNDTKPFFDYVINNTKIPDFRFLIYNGDVDTVCNYLGDAWHIENVAFENHFSIMDDMDYWYFSNNNQTAGYQMRYQGQSGYSTKMTIDVVTVKGAGHMVPSDRPGPSMQMITNFMFPGKNGVDYSSQDNVSPVQQATPLIATGASSSILFSSLLACLCVMLA